MNTRNTPSKCLRRILDKLREYNLDDEITALMIESEQVLIEARERASKASKKIGRAHV